MTPIEKAEAFIRDFNIKEGAEYIKIGYVKGYIQGALDAGALSKPEPQGLDKPRTIGKGIHKQEYTGCDMSWMDEWKYASQGLDEAAIKYLRQYDKDNDGEEPCATEVFKAGVKFQAEQGYSREVDVKEDAGGYPYINEIELYDYDNDKPLAKKGDKVRIQITKL